MLERKRAPLILSALVLGAAVATATDVEAKAIIVFKNGVEQPVDGIRSASTKKVVYTIGGSRQEEQASRVKDVIPSDRDVLEGYKSLKSGKLSSAIGSLKRGTRSADETTAAIAQYFLGKAYSLGGDPASAAKAYGELVAKSPDHFYAPPAYYEGGEAYLSLGQWAKAEEFFGKLSSFGSDWGDKGAYGKGVSLLEQGKAKEAEGVFGRLTSKGGETGALAKVGRARAQIKQGKVAGAIRDLDRMAKRGKKEPGAAGMAHVGLGDAKMQENKPKEALLEYLRSVLLYGAEVSLVPAKSGAIKAAQALKASGLIGRIRTAGGDTYSGDRPEPHFVESLMRLSAGLALEAADAALKTAQGPAKADLEFLRSDALRFTGKTAEYEKLLKELQKKYPNHPRSKSAAADIAFATFQELKKEWSEAKDETDEAKKKAAVEKIHKAYEDVIKTYSEIVAAAVKECEPIEQIEDKSKYDQGNVEKMRRRDVFKTQFVDILYSAGLTYGKGEEKRKEYLEKAREAAIEFTEVGEAFSFDLIANTYKVVGQCHLELGNMEDALYEFEALTQYIAPIRPQDPEVRKRIAEFVKNVRISGYRLFAKACVSAGQFDRAVQAFANLEKTFPNYEKSREGLLAMFELSKCLAGMGRTAEALEKIMPLVEKPEEFKIEGIDSTSLKVEASKALAGLSEATGGEIFPPKVQFQVGLGFKILGDDEKAIVGYKGVLTSAVSAEDRKEWVPKAVVEMGTLLFVQKRYLEAALAYRVLYKEFPDHPRAGESVGFARKCVSEAMEQFKVTSGPLAKLKKEIEDDLGKISQGPAAAQVAMKNAGKLQVDKRYKEAAEGYLSVPKTYKDKKSGKVLPIKFYANAIANAGYCFFKAYEKSEGKDTALADSAVKELNRALKIAKETDDDKSRALAAYYLGELYNYKKEFSKALEALALFDGELQSVASFRVRSARQQVVAFLATDKPKEAEQRWERVKDEDRDPLLKQIMLLDLADWFARQAGQMAEKNGDKATITDYRKRAADYAAQWIAASKKLSRSALLWAAGVVVNGGRLDDAVPIYERLFKEHPRPAVTGRSSGEEAKKEAALHVSYDYAELNMARAYLARGKFEEAEKLLSGLKNLVVFKRNDTLVARGELLNSSRETLKDGDGNAVQCKVFEVKEGDKTEFYMVPPGKAEPTVAKGKDATRIFSRSDMLRMVQRFKSNFVVLDALAEASWGKYQKTRDKSYLSKDVQAHWNSLYLFVAKAIDEDQYSEMATDLGLDEKNYYEKRMSIAYRLLEISFEREDWKKIPAEVDTFERMGFLKGISAELKKKFMDIKARAAAK